MNRLTKASLFAGLITISFVIGAIIGCSDDIVLEPLPSLLGEYEGRYELTENYGAPTAKTDKYPITWRFSDQNYWMWNADDSSDAICEPSGEYNLADGVEIIQREEGCAGAVSDPGKNPVGAFSLRQPGDSIYMTQIIDDIHKEIVLWPAGS